MSNEEKSTALVPTDDSSLQPATLAQLREFAETFAVSQLLPAHLRDRPADVAITVLYGRELGLTPMQAIQGIFVIEGKPSVSALTAVALVKRSPACEYFRLVESTDQRAVYETKRRGEPEPTRMEFTVAEAQQAGLFAKKGDTWKKYTKAMLRNRAAMALARDVYPDVVANVLDPDEVDDTRASSGHLAPPPPQPSSAAPAAPAAAWKPPAGTIEASATVAPVKSLLERVKSAADVQALVALGADCKAAPQADHATLREAYAKRKAELVPPLPPAATPAAKAQESKTSLPADGKPAPGWGDDNRMPKPDPQAGEQPRGQVTREDGRVSMGDAKTGGPAVSKTWGDVLEAGAAPPVERVVGADDDE